MIDARVIESWRYAWRAGVAPCLSTKALVALRAALECDSPRIVQGKTTVPAPMYGVMDWPCEAGCALGFAAMVEGMDTVAEVSDFFAAISAEIDNRMGEPAGCRWFYNWWDSAPREEAFAALLAEVNLVLSGRKVDAA